MKHLSILLLVVCAWRAAACDGQSMNVRLVNDTDQTLDFLQCKERFLGAECDDIGGRSGRDRAPGESYTALISVGATTWYRLEGESGSTLGCLRMEFDDYAEDVEVFASQAVECP